MKKTDLEIIISRKRNDTEILKINMRQVILDKASAVFATINQTNHDSL